MDECKPLPVSIPLSSTSMMLEMTSASFVSQLNSLAADRAGCCQLEVQMIQRSPAARQGLTLVNYSAQRKHFIWARGCIQGPYRGCIAGVYGIRGCLGCILCKKRLRLS